MNKPVYLRGSRLLLILLLLYALMVTFGGCADRFVLPPVPSRIAPDGSERRLLADGSSALEVFIARSPGAVNVTPQAFVLRMTGDAAGAAKFTASRWAELPVEVWIVNYPGYGASSGPRTLGAMVRAALAAYDKLRLEAGDRPVFVEGFSLGTAPALTVAARRPVAGVLLQNPPALREVALTHGWWNLWLIALPVAMQVPRELDSMENAKRANAPAVFLMAEKDESVPFRLQRKLAEIYSGEKRVLVQRGAGHVAPLTPADEVKLHEAMSWLWQHKSE